MLQRWFQLFLYGICMGTADVVPGVSGGTVAFIMGIYEELLSSIKHFWRHLGFLIPLCMGIVTAIGSLAGLMQVILNHDVYRSWLYSLFFGLIAASIWFCARQVPKWKTSHFFALGCGAVLAFALTTVKFEADPSTLYEVIVGEEILTGVSDQTLSAMVAKGIIDFDTPVHQEGYTYVVSEVVSSQSTFPINGWLVFCGVVAVCAMLLPGISGSYMLVILGAYPLVISAVADFVKGDIYAFWQLCSVGIGIVIGAVAFSRVVSWLLKQYHNGTVATLIGFMFGAMPAVWPFWSYSSALDPLNLAKGAQLQPLQPTLPDLGSPVFLVGVLLALIGFLLVVVMERSARRHQAIEVR